MRPKYLLIPASVFILCILIFGFTFGSSSERKQAITWSDRALVWEDFELVDHMEEDYVAAIYSLVSCPDLITENNSRVYAFMNPNLSQRLKDQYDSYNVLVHEQYHFNITEYCARLLRKEIVEKGLGGLSYSTTSALKEKYAKKLDSLQDVYDSITDHNADTEMQRYWELKIDDWLRQTAYYANEDIYSYYEFTQNRTPFFRKIYATSTHNILTSYPVGEKEMAYGETYEISYQGHNEKTVKFYKDGKLTNGGTFETAITRIFGPKNGMYEIHYYNPDETYNTNVSVSLLRSTIDKRKNRTDHYYDQDGLRITKDSIFETRWDYKTEDDEYYTSYFDRAGEEIANSEGMYHERRKLDKKERTIIVENLDKYYKPKNDDEYIAKYKADFNDDHQKSRYRFYDENGDFAFHLNDYHLGYEYDKRGNIVKVTSLDSNGEPTYDKNGASIYRYSYDLHDRETSVKRFNTKDEPIIANDNYFHKVKEYDSLGRVTFEAYYYPEYVLKFSDEKDGASKYDRENEAFILQSNVDVYNNVYENNKKVAIVKYTLDSDQNIMKETYLDSDNNFAKTEDGVVAYGYTYDDKGNKIETVAYDSLGKPKAFEADVAIIRWKYDDRGNKLQTTYYNENGKLAHATDSITYNFYKYNKKNQLIERSYFNIEMKPAQKDGVFKKKFVPNLAGLDSLWFEYNSEGQLLKDGVAITKYFYNKYGNKTREEYYDFNRQRTKNDKGISAINYSYNKRQQLIGYEYLDKGNRLTNTIDGVAIEKSNVDDLGHTLTYSYFDKNRKPALGEFGYHKVEYEWSGIGETTKTSMFGTDKKLIEDEYGTAIYEYERFPSGLIETIKRYNREGLLSDNSSDVAISHYEPKLNGLYFLKEELNAEGEVVNDSIAN